MESDMYFNECFQLYSPEEDRAITSSKYCEIIIDATLKPVTIAMNRYTCIHTQRKQKNLTTFASIGKIKPLYL